MAGQEIEGDLWDQSLGLDLLPPIACAGFRTLHLESYRQWHPRPKSVQCFRPSQYMPGFFNLKTIQFQIKMTCAKERKHLKTANRTVLQSCCFILG